MDFSRLKALAKTEYEQELVRLLDQEAQSRQHTEVPDEPDGNSIGKGEFKIGSDGFVYLKLNDGTVRKITHNAV